MKVRTDAKLRISSPHKKFRNQTDVDVTKLALLIEIPYFLLKEWHGRVTGKTNPEATAPDYISLADDLIPRHCVQISQDSGQRINGNLARKVGEVKTLYRNNLLIFDIPLFILWHCCMGPSCTNLY